MRTLTWTGTLRADSSIAHGGLTSGTVHQFRRETLVAGDGTLISGVPVLSGSVIRGVLRRHAATMTQMALADITGDDKLTYQVLHALRSGGSLRERRANEEAITGGKQAELRDCLPEFSLFGGGVGTRIVSGRTMIDKGIPLARETAHLAEHYGVTLTNPAALPSVWQLIQRESYARQADVLTGDVGHLISNPEEVELPRGGGQMLYAIETIPMGTRLIHSITAEAATPVEQAFMVDLVTSWSRNARVGGQLAKGHGKVTPTYTLNVTTVGGEPADLEPADWRTHMADNIDRVTEVLSWL